MIRGELMDEYTNYTVDQDWWDTDDKADGICPHCDGDGFGIVGVDWDCEDGINGPYDGDTERCPWCYGSGKMSDVWLW